MTLCFAPQTSTTRPLFALRPDEVAAWADTRPAPEQRWIAQTGFAGQAGRLCLLPDASGAVTGAVFGLGPAAAAARTRFALAQARAQLPGGAWQLATPMSEDDASEGALGWLLAGYRFDRYATRDPASDTALAVLVAPANVDAARLERIAAGEALIRDLINTPANDMGPENLEQATRELAEAFGARLEVIQGTALESGFPLIATVGRASARPPRLLDLRWGDGGPRVTLVGKGVCFDTGGLNLKPGASMGLMKKDMGGAANALGLARMIMAQGLPVRLRLLVPAVENSVSGAAFRPQDILKARNGRTVEINNTDAEGRLVLADALSLADEENPDLLVSLATLTGAARVAVGPDIAPYFTDMPDLPALLGAAAERVRDPVWQLPFHAPYEAMIEPGIADLDNAPSGGLAGAITAALFLRRFVSPGRRYVHFDLYGWQPAPEPARPKGGVGQGVRALFDALPRLLDLSD